jgi:multidrug efflux pump subunit AcrA (membrane-fusion protein)
MAASAVFRRALGMARRGLWVVVLVAVMLLVAWFRVWSPVRVEVARLDRGTITQEAFGRGTIESQREAAVGFDLVGRLSEVLVDEGTRVTLGQELARLETNQAQADLRSAQTGIGAARASLQRLAAEEERARAQFLVSSAMRRATAFAWRAPSSIVSWPSVPRRLVASTSRPAAQSSDGSPWCEPRCSRPSMAS